MSNTSILQYFPSNKKPRRVQAEALEQLADGWADSNLIVVNLPVASGKSAIAHTIAHWQYATLKNRSAILTPTNILVEQYLKDFPDLHRVKRIDQYYCSLHSEQTGPPVNCAKARSWSASKKLCRDCPYTKALIKAQKWAPSTILNYYSYLSVRPDVPVMIIDEAHNLIGAIREQSASKLWQHSLGYPNNTGSYNDLYQWALSVKDTFSTPRKNKLIQRVIEELENGRTRYLFQRTREKYKGEEEDVIKLLPVDVRDEAPIFWPSTVQKIILMSATISTKDIEQLGLNKLRSLFINSGSPIAPERRPFHLHTRLHNLAHSSVDASLPALAEDIRILLRTNPEKGFIHATYGMAEKLRPFLQEEPRLLWHDRENKMARYEEFRRATPDTGRVMVASGLYEGVDLPQDLGRWQVITKVPWPSLAEQAIVYQMEKDPEWYANEAVKIVLQAYGRICRTVDDYGRTVMLDNSFNRLYAGYSHLFPEWFKEALNRSAV
jgi:Rad3-related DNA helicase